MNYKIRTIKVFDRQVKRLTKKYPSLKKELQNLLYELSSNPKLGESLGSNCYKIRLSIASKGKGKSGGGRVIIHIIFVEKTIYLLSIYDKSEIATLTDKEILSLIKQI